MAPVSDRVPPSSRRVLPLATTSRQRQMHYRRTVDLVIPYQVASPQSLTPFHQDLFPPILVSILMRALGVSFMICWLSASDFRFPLAVGDLGRGSAKSHSARA